MIFTVNAENVMYSVSVLISVTHSILNKAGFMDMFMDFRVSSLTKDML